MRLTIGEAHTYITQGLQRQGAFKKDKQHWQAVDLAINKAMHRFLRNSVKPIEGTSRFQINEPSREDVQSLLVTNYPITFIQSVDSGRYFRASLPPDMKYLINDKSNTVEDCIEAFNNATETRSRKYYYFDLVNGPVDSNGKYYKSIVITVPGKTVTISHGGFTSSRDKVYLIEYIINALKAEGYTAYWENFAGKYKVNSFIVPVDNLTASITITFDGTPLTRTEELVSTTNLVKTTLPTDIVVANRSVRTDLIDNVCDSRYSRPRVVSPVSIVSNDYIEVYSDKKFLVSRLLLDYIRIPKPVNLSLNYGFEMHESTHDRICDVAIEILKEQTENPSLSTTIQYNQLKDNK